MLVDERKIIMPYGADVAFHCQKCGGFVDEYGKCQFCGSQNQLRYEPQKSMQLYIEMDKDKKFYFNHVDSMSYEPRTDCIDYGREIDGRIIPGFNTNQGLMRLRGLASDDAAFKFDMIMNAHKFVVNGVIPAQDKTYRFGVDYVANLKYEPSSIGNIGFMELTLYVGNMDGWVGASMEAPEGARCPNCGAPIRKTYGLCDYCGGWVEYR